jgi:hypothetical protein
MIMSILDTERQPGQNQLYMKHKLRQVFAHILFCIGFLSIPLLFNPGHELINGLEGDTPRDLTGYVCTLVYFYVNYYYFVPRLYLFKKYFLFFLVTIVCFVMITFLPNVFFPQHGNGMYGRPPMSQSFDAPPDFNKHVDGQHHGPPPDMRSGPGKPFGPEHEMRKPFFFGDINHNLFRFLVIFLISLMLKINEQWKKAQKDKLQAELSYLKAQINPHFLFNTLNTIYSLAVEKSDNAPGAVVKLSDMMRYVLNEADKDYVPLDKEIKYISNYIELQKGRFGDTVKVDYTVNGNTTRKTIAPLVLIPFIENAYKHGINPEEESAIEVLIDIHPKAVQLYVSNKKVAVQQRLEEKSGLGIENTKSRLNLLYPGKYELNITDDGNKFTVLLNIDIA